MIRAVGVLLALIVASGCAGSPEGTETEREPETTPRVEPLVGTWERETHCQEMVSALERAGLENWVLEFVAGNGFIPAAADPGEIQAVTDPDQIADTAHPCRGAVPRVHSHFFTPDGEFDPWTGTAIRLTTAPMKSSMTTRSPSRRSSPRTSRSTSRSRVTRSCLIR